MLELITNKTVFNFLLKFIGITLIWHYMITNFFKVDNSKEVEKKSEPNSFKSWMGIMHVFGLIICVILLFKISILYTVFEIFALIFYISLLLIYFLQMCCTSLIRKETELNAIELNSYLYFSALFLILINNSNTSRIYEILASFSSNYSEIFNNLFVLILLAEIFFSIFNTVYCILIWLKGIKQLLLFLKNKIKFNIKINFKDNKFVKFVCSTERYYYDFYFFMKYKKNNILKLILFCIDFMILILMTFISFFIWIIRIPLFTFGAFFKLIYYIVIRIVNTDTSMFVFKWFRIIFIISILITYIILKINSFEKLEISIEIFETISTVILIPLIWEQLSEIREKNK